MEKINLRDLSFVELNKALEELGQPRYRAEQLFSWIHKRGIFDLDQMSNIPKDLREKLKENWSFNALACDKVLKSSDGTRKIRYRCIDGALIESVLIPRSDYSYGYNPNEAEKITLCVSSQVGCALGCEFCATATLGLKRNLNAGEIVDQIYLANQLLEENETISNLVFMGMGEPMANLERVLKAVGNLTHEKGLDFSPRRITISTVGHVTGIQKLGERMPNLGLAISLHATTNEQRSQLMPLNKRWPLDDLFKALKAYPLPRRRRITFEYMLLENFNDRREDINRLAKLLDGIPSKVNVLAFNPWRDDQPDMRRPSDESVDFFAEKLRAKGLTVTVRQSRGQDIDAACGQLALSTK